MTYYFFYHEGKYSDHDLYVGRIPGSITHDHLQQLFPQAISIEYKQGKVTRDGVKLGYDMNQNIIDTLTSFRFVNTRFAFVDFGDKYTAAKVIKHSDQYYIDNQPLLISYKRLNNTLIKTN